MITSITLTRVQFKELSKLNALSDDWFERLADITECPPETLRERIPFTVFLEDVATRDAKIRGEKNMWRSKAHADRDVVWFINPVSQAESGVMKYIE